MLVNERTLRYNPPISLFYIAILLISFTFSLTFFQYTNFLNYIGSSREVSLNKIDNQKTLNSTQKSKEKSISEINDNKNAEKQEEDNSINKEDNDKKEDQEDNKKLIKEDDKKTESPKEEDKKEDKKDDNENAKDKVDAKNTTEKIFENGRTFDHLYSKDLNSPFYNKEFPKLEADTEKMEAVKEAFLHAWSNYDHFCFGHDTFHPKSLQCGDGNLHGGLTLIDSISTIIIMGLEEPYKKVRQFVEDSFAPEGSWSLFEFNIRYLGGLLSAYSLSKDDVFKKAAVGLGNAVNNIMEKTNGFFSSSFRLTVRDREKQIYSARASKSSSYILAECGTFQLEFLKLAEITGESKFIDSAMNVYKILWRKNKNRGLISSHIGAGTDSYYEYIIKSYLMTGGVVNELLNRHNLMMNDIRSNLVFKTVNQELVGIGTKNRGGKRPSPDVEHLATFAAGMIALGTVKSNKDSEEDLKLASDLATTYAKTYAHFQSGIMPEHVIYNIRNKDEKEDIRMSTDGYILRPETVESIFYLYRFTGDQKYRDYNWQIFKAINRSCRVPHGFTSITRLENPPENVNHKDEMESFFLAETLKYLYLTFTDSSLISPAEWVFNTEAHPLHMWDEETIQKYSKDIDVQLSKGINRERIRDIERKDNGDEDANSDDIGKHKKKDTEDINRNDNENIKNGDDSEDRKDKDIYEDRKRRDIIRNRRNREYKKDRKNRDYEDDRKNRDYEDDRKNRDNDDDRKNRDSNEDEREKIDEKDDREIRLLKRKLRDSIRSKRKPRREDDDN